MNQTNESRPRIACVTRHKSFFFPLFYVFKKPWINFVFVLKKKKWFPSTLTFEIVITMWGWERHFSCYPALYSLTVHTAGQTARRHDSLGFPLSVTLKSRGSLDRVPPSLLPQTTKIKEKKHGSRNATNQSKPLELQNIKTIEFVQKGKAGKKKLTLWRWRKEGWNSRDDEDLGATTWFPSFLFCFSVVACLLLFSR